MSDIFVLDLETYQNAVRERFPCLDEEQIHPFAIEDDKAISVCGRKGELFSRRPDFATYFNNDTICENGLMDVASGNFERTPKYPDCSSCPVGQGSIEQLATRLERALF